MPLLGVTSFCTYGIPIALRLSRHIFNSLAEVRNPFRSQYLNAPPSKTLDFSTIGKIYFWAFHWHLMCTNR